MGKALWQCFFFRVWCEFKRSAVKIHCCFLLSLPQELDEEEFEQAPPPHTEQSEESTSNKAPKSGLKESASTSYYDEEEFDGHPSTVINEGSPSQEAPSSHPKQGTFLHVILDFKSSRGLCE